MAVVVFKDHKLSELVETHALNLANDLAGQHGTGETTKTQLRKFYQEYVGIRERIIDEDAYKRYEPKVKMMLSKAAYAWRGGNQAKIPRPFYEWITANIKAINCKQDVYDFGDYFEALVGYFYSTTNGNHAGGRR